MRFRSFVLVAAVAFALLSWLGARQDFCTYDEGPFLDYGLRHLAGPVARTPALNSKLPVMALHALPLAAAGQPALQRLPDGSSLPAPWALARARAVGVVLGVALVVVLALGARSVLGARAAAAAALVAALEPDLLAHAHCATPDAAAALAVLLLVLATARLRRTGRLADAALVGAAFGAVLLCKFMLVVLGAVIPVALLRRSTRLGSYGASLLVAVGAALLVLAAGFAFRGLPGRLPEHPKSHKVSLAAALVGRAPLPVPQDYLDGLDWTAADEESGGGFGNLYLLGDLQRGAERRGWAHYYVVVLALKLPLALLVLAGVSLATRGAPELLHVSRLHGLAWLVFLSAFNHAQIGVRHALPLVPLAILEAARGYALVERSRPWLARALVAWLALSVASFAPDFLPYTNELTLDRGLAYRRIADSNLDYGQAKGAAIEFLRANPDVVFAPPGPVRARVLVSVNALVGITAPPDQFAWLRERRPVAHVRHAYLVFDTR